MKHMIHTRLAFNIGCASYRVVIFPSTYYPILAMFFLLVWMPVGSAIGVISWVLRTVNTGVAR